MEFIINNGTGHLDKITNLISKSDEVLMSVAFVKQSGVTLLQSVLKAAIQRDTYISIIAGQYFALTEPEALYTLHELFKGKKNCAKLYLAKAEVKNRVFHPKLYLFRKGDTGTIISGSANVTSGGLENNIECSLMVKCNVADQVWKDAYAFIQNLIRPENSEEASLLVIGKYKEFYVRQKKYRDKMRAVPDITKSQKEFNYENLLLHFNKYLKKNGPQWLDGKLNDYKQAIKILNRIADDNDLTQESFADMLDALVGSANAGRWWHSGSLFRNKTEVYTHYKMFQQLVRYIRANKGSRPSIVFDEAKRQVNAINGAGVNYITEIMMTYNPDTFANLNKNPITVLTKEGGVSMKITPTSYNGNDYEEYCNLVKEISVKLGLRNMLEADSFFNEIYWPLAQKLKKAKHK